MANFTISSLTQITLGTDDADVFTYVPGVGFTYVQGAGGNDQFTGAGDGIMDGQDGDDLFNFAFASAQLLAAMAMISCSPRVRSAATTS